MFIFPKSILQIFGNLMGYLFNFIIVGLGIKMCIISLQNGDRQGFLGAVIVTLLFGSWTAFLVISGFKREKKKKKQQDTN